MQNAELGRLAVRGARRDPKPLLVVRQLLHAAQIELGGYAQSRKRVRLAVGGADQEFTASLRVSLCETQYSASFCSTRGGRRTEIGMARCRTMRSALYYVPGGLLQETQRGYLKGRPAEQSFAELLYFC